MELIAQGAEGKIFLVDENTLKKTREPKTYRLPQIDNKLRKFRCKREVKVLNKLFEEGINVPKVFDLIVNKEEVSFTMENLKGNILKSVLDKELLFKAFEQVVKMHNLGIVHKDLTTLNMIEVEKEIFLIDFGLSEFSINIEEKACDLNLFFTCIKNEHPDLFYLKQDLEEKYLDLAENSEKIIDRLRVVEHRGRNK